MYTDSTTGTSQGPFLLTMGLPRTYVLQLEHQSARYWIPHSVESLQVYLTIYPLQSGFLRQAITVTHLGMVKMATLLDK